MKLTPLIWRPKDENNAKIGAFIFIFFITPFPPQSKGTGKLNLAKYDIGIGFNPTNLFMLIDFQPESYKIMHILSPNYKLGLIKLLFLIYNTREFIFTFPIPPHPPASKGTGNYETRDRGLSILSPRQYQITIFPTIF